MLSLFLSISIFGADINLDSLLREFESQDLSNKYEELTKFSEYIGKNIDAIDDVIYIEKVINLLENTNFDSLKIDLLRKKAIFFENNGELVKSLDLYEKALDIALEKNIHYYQAEIHNDIGILYMSRGEYEKAITNFISSLSISEKIEELNLSSLTLNNLGNIYLYQENYIKSLNYYQRSYEINKQLNNQEGIATAYNNIGIVNYCLGEYEKVLDYFKKALKIYEELNDLRNQSFPLFNIGEVYYEQGKYDLALIYLNRSLNIDRELNDKEGITKSLNFLGKIYCTIGNVRKALQYLREAKSIALEVGLKSELIDIYLNLSNAFQKIGNHKMALDYYKLYNEIGDSIFDLEKAKQIEEIEAMYQNDKKQQQIELQESQLARKDLEVKQQSTQKIMLLVGFIFLLILFLLILRNNNIRKKINKMLAHQKNQIEHQKNKITDSIEYARIIQTAALPPHDFLKKILPEHFILFLPRDIVSGDFFWATRKNDQTVIAAADCTGHGVPGAFMSMLGISFLTEIINRAEHVKADRVLNRLRKNIISSLHQTGKIGETRDGMDIAICVLNEDYSELEYAGAFNPLVIVRDDNLIQVAADKMPIGVHDEIESPFKSHNIKLHKGDTIYLFSDGYADQFGGPFNKKFKMQPFLSLLLANHQRPMIQQKQILYDTILNWKGDNDQIDDILVMAFRV